MARKVAVALYCLVALAFIVKGIEYTTTRTYMDYHADVVDVPWDNITDEHQHLVLGLLKGFGAGMLGVGMAVLQLALLPLRRGKRWARTIIAAITITYCINLLYVTGYALLPSAVPIRVTVTLMALSMLAALLSVIDRQMVRRAQQALAAAGAGHF